jgi:hypothetical protein
MYHTCISVDSNSQFTFAYSNAFFSKCRTNSLLLLRKLNVLQQDRTNSLLLLEKLDVL